MSFPDDFAWGSATASYQIEGAHDADGKGLSVWDAMCRWPGKVKHGDTGDVACDHYHQFSDDVKLMADLGLKAYRLSISWPRVLPDGTTAHVNEAGLKFYDELVDALLDAGIEPWVTLFHWDFPLDLYRRGGWLSPESPQWFEDYSRLIVDRLSDRVTNWMTLNEPQVFLSLGHREGTHAPGAKLDWPDVLTASHHALLAHGRAVQVIREHAKKSPTVGWAPVGVIRYPAGNRDEYVDAARDRMFSIREPSLWNNTWFSDAALLGHYPEDGLRIFGDAAPKVKPGDMETIRQPLDFYGANIYNGQPIGTPDDADAETPRPAGYANTHMEWPVEPDSLYWGPRFLHERYQLPIVITENGLANPDWVDLDGNVRDPQRIDFTRRYLLRLRDAVQDGVDVKGYFHWSLMDNFEWAEGYAKRFGLIHVDYQTLKRTPKASFHWYRNVIATNGASLDDPVT